MALIDFLVEYVRQLPNDPHWPINSFDCFGQTERPPLWFIAINDCNHHHKNDIRDVGSTADFLTVDALMLLK